MTASSPPAACLPAGRTIALAQGLRVIVRLGTAALLARLLTPAEYGIYGMAAAVFGFLYMARDFGIVTAMQQQGGTIAHTKAFVRLGCVGGCALAMLGVALATPTALFFANATAGWVLAAMSLAFVFSGASAPAIGVLYQHQQAGLVALLDAAALLLGSLAGIAGACFGAGVWALVIMGVATDAAACALAWRFCPWPSNEDRGEAPWRALATLGANLTAYNIAAYCTRILDQVVVGRTSGTTALGLYGRGAQLTALPAQYGVAPFTPMMVADLARLHNQPAAYAAVFRRGLNGLLHVAFAGAAVCVAVPEVLLVSIFGPQWSAAAPVVRWLGIGLAMQPFLSAPYWLLGGHGRSHRLLGWSALGVAVMLVGCAIAARRGMEPIAMAAALATCVQASLGPIFSARCTAVALGDWLRPALLPALLHGGAAAMLFLVDRALLAAKPPMPRASALLATGSAYYAGMYFLSATVRGEIRARVSGSR